MALQIKCPHCGQIFEEDETKFSSIITQVRDHEFNHEVEKRVQEQTRLMQETQDSQLEVARAEVREKAQKELDGAKVELAQKDAQIRELLARLDGHAAQAAAEQKLAVQEAQKSMEKQVQSAELARSEANHKAELVQAELTQLARQLAQQQSLLEEQKRHEQKALQEQEQAAQKQLITMIEMKDQEIESIKHMRAMANTKMIGEELETWCQEQFLAYQAAFPYATFEKDTKAEEGTKGDFIFRDYDSAGNEFCSIMFEMKNEEEASQNKKKNEAHFEKLHKDRVKKNCEFAVLVTTLEKESEFYNRGIVDISKIAKHPNMFAVRPQNFIPLLMILDAAAKNTVVYKAQIAQLKEESIDITNFGAALDTFKTGFSKNYSDATKKFGEAIEGIDKAIAQLEKIKESFRLTEKHLTTASKKVDDLTIKQLTKHSPSLKAQFDALPAAAASTNTNYGEKGE